MVTAAKQDQDEHQVPVAYSLARPIRSLDRKTKLHISRKNERRGQQICPNAVNREDKEQSLDEYFISIVTVETTQASYLTSKFRVCKQPPLGRPNLKPKAGNREPLRKTERTKNTVWYLPLLYEI